MNEHRLSVFPANCVRASRHRDHLDRRIVTTKIGAS